MASGLEIDAALTIALNGDEVQVAGSGTYLILSVPSQRALDRLTSGPPPDPHAPPKPKTKGPDPLRQLHELAGRLGLVLELRVAGKTYVTFGQGSGPKITLSAVLGKIGSFFRRD